MVKIYATACEKDGKNFNTVPKSMQAKVKAQIEADGYAILNDGTVVLVVEEAEEAEETAEEENKEDDSNKEKEDAE